MSIFRFCVIFKQQPLVPIHVNDNNLYNFVTSSLLKNENSQHVTVLPSTIWHIRAISTDLPFFYFPVTNEEY